MNKIVCFISLAFCVVFSGWTPSVQLSVRQAVIGKKAKVSFKSEGGHSGKCVLVQVTNLTKTRLEIKLASGEMLNSADNNEQDLLIVHDQPLVLAAGQTTSFPIEGFCCQLHNKSPGKGNGFIIDKPKQDKLLKLCSYLCDKPLPMSAIQEAIWCVSDDNNPSNIDGGNTPTMRTKIEDLRKYVCKLTGKPDPWYTTPQERIITPQREIINNPVTIYGEIQYTLDEAKPIDGEVRNENNEVIMSMPDKSPPQAGTFIYNFKLRVEGFPKGKYHVLLKSGGMMMMDKEFVL
jgi:hypothetical protein